MFFFLVRSAARFFTIPLQEHVFDFLDRNGSMRLSPPLSNETPTVGLLPSAGSSGAVLLLAAPGEPLRAARCYRGPARPSRHAEGDAFRECNNMEQQCPAVEQLHLLVRRGRRGLRRSLDI